MPRIEQVDGLLSRARWRTALPFIAVGVLGVIAVLLLGREVAHHIALVERWIAGQGTVGLIIFIGLLVLATSLLVPESLFAIAAGALFGISLGLAVILVSNMLAAVVQYALARRLLRGRIQKMLASRPQLAAIERAVMKDERRLQLLLRLTPLNPASLSYVFGAAGVRFPGFLLGCIALVPHLFMEVYLGNAGKHLTRIGAGAPSHSLVHEVAVFGGLCVSAVVVFIVSRIARKAIARILTEEKEKAVDRSG